MARVTPEQLYEAWREPSSLHWNEILAPVNRTPRGELNQSEGFVRSCQAEGAEVRAEAEEPTEVQVSSF